jgi:putative membrane protein
MINYLPHVNASLNAIATILLIIGYVLIRNRKENAHKATMLSAFGVSVVFLVCYVIYHYHAGSKQFPREDYSPAITYSYLVLLASHVLLAAVVPFLAVTTITLGLLDKRMWHRKIARITFPIWLYVSITGVLVYLMLYHWFVPV